jgi:hypothetical protein
MRSYSHQAASNLEITLPDYSPDLEHTLSFALAEAQRTHSRVLGTPYLWLGNRPAWLRSVCQAVCYNLDQL